MWSRERRRRLRNWLAGRLGPAVIRLWTKSLRLRVSGLPLEDGVFVIPPCLAVIWHQQLLAITGCFRGLGIQSLVSQHADGEMLARVLHGLGYEAVRGSTTRGGVRALRQILEQSNAAVRLAITPDGPRGPPMVMQQGPIYLASHLQLPILPMVAVFGHAWQLRTWDRFLLPRPFTRAFIRLDELQQVPPGLDRDGVEEWRRKIETRFLAFLEETRNDFDALYGKATVFRKARFS